MCVCACGRAAVCVRLMWWECCAEPFAARTTANHSFRNPYVMPMNKQREVDECRRALSCHSQSDHYALLRAITQYKAARRRGQGRQYCWKHFLSESVRCVACRDVLVIAPTLLCSDTRSMPCLPHECRRCA